jgi:hypothetical protein
MAEWFVSLLIRLRFGNPSLSTGSLIRKEARIAAKNLVSFLKKIANSGKIPQSLQHEAES